jgi:translation initiation factor 2B subunit (eIF-2B alpha/beta/delta family)
MEFANVLYDRHLSDTEIERRLVAALLETASFDLGALTDLVLEIHPERGSWVGLSNRLWLASAGAGAQGVKAVLAERAAELSSGRLQVAERLLDAFGPRRVLLTLSNQPCVVTALAASAGRRRVILGESRPLREGVTAARDLAAVGVDVTVVSDAVLLGLPLTCTEWPPPLRFERADAVVILGADALLAGGFVAKSGSRALAEIAALTGLEVIVSASLDRLLPAELATSFVPPTADPVDLGAPAAVHPVHHPCEFLPWRLASRVLVESEILAPADLASRAAQLELAPELRVRWLERFS